MAVDVPTLAQALSALGSGDQATVLKRLEAAADALQDQIDAGQDADPPQDTTDLENQFTLVNEWIRALVASMQPAPPASADQDLLNAMQAVDAATATSAALNGLLIAVDGLVKSFGGG